MFFKRNFILLTCGIILLQIDNLYGQNENEEKIDIQAEEAQAIEIINQEEVALVQEFINEVAEIYWAGMEKSKYIDDNEEVTAVRDAFTKHVQEYADSIRQLPNWPVYENYTASRIARIEAIYNPRVVDETGDEYTALIDKLSKHQSQATLCTYDKNDACESTAFDIDELMQTIDDVERLTELWMEPKTKLGLNEFREDYKRLAELWEIAAQVQNYDNAVNLRLEVYRLADELYDDSMANHYVNLWKEVKPMYEKLHAVCLHLLQKKYGEDCKSQGGLMPAIFVGHFGQEWHRYSHIFNFYNTSEINDCEPIADITAKMKSMEKERGIKDYVILASELLSSMNLLPLPEDFIENSYFEKDEDKKCDGYYFLDFMDGERMRTGVCSKLDMIDIADLYGICGLAEQAMQYAHLPFSLQQAATSAWDAALNYFMVANFYSPIYLKNIGLLGDDEQSEQTIKYYLMQLVLQFYPLVAHAVVLESYRDEFYLGKIKVKHANYEWYSKIANIQGLYPPVQMSEKGFHPASKANIMRDQTYINWMYQPIFGLELYKYLCEICNKCSNGEYLHECDLTGCVEAGEILKQIMQYGAEFSWQTIYKEVFKTDVAEMSAKAMNRYFKIIEEDLDNYIDDNDLTVGWEVDDSIIFTSESSDTCE